jgi:hypothetical protein
LRGRDIRRPIADPALRLWNPQSLSRLGDARKDLVPIRFAAHTRRKSHGVWPNWHFTATKSCVKLKSLVRKAFEISGR